ncbi:MAG: hypothetical protein J6K33_05215 [Alistipes sp.]|nr:hypothetical protein [Alistipes sp.]
MKKFLRLFIIAAISCCTCISCEKEELEGGTTIGSMEDLLGTYSVTVRENIIWGGDSGTLYDNGIIEITQIYGNRVQLRGLISTQGELVNGKLYLNSETSSDIYGFLTTTYNSVIFGGGIITIWAKVSGQLASNGVLYPYSSSSYFEGIKIQ